MDKDNIIYAIERADCIIPPIPGFIEYLDIPGVTACLTSVANPMANRVSNARLTSANTEPTIAEIKKQYDSHGKDFCWSIGPHTRPDGLEKFLEQAGMEPTYGSDGMYLTDLNLRVKINPAIKITEVTPDTPGDAVGIMVEGFDMTEEASHYYHEMLYHSSKQLRCRIYLAYLKNEPKAVACCYMTYYPDQPVALLGGATTILACRGQGIYTAMLKHRLEDARRDGIEVAIIIADRTTSAPICKKVGFTKICNMELYLAEDDHPTIII